MLGSAPGGSRRGTLLATLPCGGPWQCPVKDCALVLLTALCGWWVAAAAPRRIAWNSRRSLLPCVGGGRPCAALRGIVRMRPAGTALFLSAGGEGDHECGASWFQGFYIHESVHGCVAPWRFGRGIIRPLS